MWTLNVPLVCSTFMVCTIALSAVSPDEPLEKDETIDYVNSLQTTWTAQRNFHPSLRMSDARYLAGSRIRPEGSRLKEYEPDNSEPIDLPSEFDARLKWRNCTGLQNITNQGYCGSCWAVSAASVLSDRLCIATNGHVDVQLSAQELTTCCNTCWDPPNSPAGGCDGGEPTPAWEFFLEQGVVTGNDNGRGCQPYNLRGKHLNVPCKKQCYNKNYNISFNNDNHKASRIFKMTNMRHIQEEIFLRGPVQACFDVYDDFISFKAGVYKYVWGSNTGQGHCVRVIGWGADAKHDGEPYWLVTNSWGVKWGTEHGLFKMRKGYNDCGFESEMYAGYPELKTE